MGTRSHRPILSLAGGSAALLLCACTPSGARTPAAKQSQSHPVATQVAVSSGDVVPWIDAAPPPYQPPAMSTPPPLPADARPCRAADVSISLEPRNGAGGHTVSYVRFRNVSQSTCLLAGYPKV